MQKKLILLCLLLLLALAPGFAAEDTIEEPAEPNLEAVAHTQGIPVLMYHHILPESILAAQPYNAAVIAFESFKAQMKWLKESGWTALTLDEFHQAMTSDDPLPEKSFVITFDDGYASNLFFAFPTLNRYGFPAAEFIITANLEEETRKWDGKKLSWKDVEAISGLFSIHSHTHAFHQTEDGKPLLTVRSDAEIQSDLDFAWEEIERHVEPGLRAFAYPYGVSTESTMEILKNQDVKLAFTTKEGYATQASELLLIPRFSITPSVTMEAFMAIFEPDLQSSDDVDTTESTSDEALDLDASGTEPADDNQEADIQENQF